MIYSFVFSTYQQYFSQKTVAIDYENFEGFLAALTSLLFFEILKNGFCVQRGFTVLFCNRICFKIYISFTVLSGVHMYIPIRLPKNEIETLTLTCKKLTWVPKWKISMDLHSLSQQTEVRWSVFRTIIEETNIPVLLICPNRFF